MYEIAIVGIDGAGKTTICKKLSSRLAAEGYHTEYLHYKSYNAESLEYAVSCGIKVPENIRMIGYSLDLLRKWRNIYQESKDIIIWDRYIYCLYAYYRALGVDTNWLDKIRNILSKPDLVVLLQIDPEIAVRRLDKRGKGRKPLENVKYLTAVQDNYCKLKDQFSMVTIDATLSTERIISEILNCSKVRGNVYV